MSVNPYHYANEQGRPAPADTCPAIRRENPSMNEQLRTRYQSLAAEAERPPSIRLLGVRVGETAWVVGRSVPSRSNPLGDDERVVLVVPGQQLDALVLYASGRASRIGGALVEWIYEALPDDPASWQPDCPWDGAKMEWQGAAYHCPSCQALFDRWLYMLPEAAAVGDEAVYQPHCDQCGPDAILVWSEDHDRPDVWHCPDCLREFRRAGMEGGQVEALGPGENDPRLAEGDAEPAQEEAQDVREAADPPAEPVAKAKRAGKKPVV